MRIAVIAGGWHFPLHFFKAIARQQLPKGWSADLFCISHRDPKYSAEDKEEYLKNLGWSYAEVLDKILYEKIATVEDIEKLGWKYILRPNTVGDWGNTNQWLEEYDYRQYDVLLATHDDNLILNDRLYTDLLNKESPWLILTNSTGSKENLREYIKVKVLGGAMNMRGSFEFIKPELLKKLGGKFDLSATTLNREGEVHSDSSMKSLNNWNMNVVPLRAFLNSNNLVNRIYALSDTYRVSEYCIEGERGFISSVQKSDMKLFQKGLMRVQRLYEGHFK